MTCHRYDYIDLFTLACVLPCEHRMHCRDPIMARDLLLLLLERGELTGQALRDATEMRMAEFRTQSGFKAPRG